MVFSQLKQGARVKIFITGSTGLLGGRLVQFLDQNKNHKLLLGTRDLSKLPKAFAHLNAVAIDWTLQRQLDIVCDSVDCIVHLAGMNAGQCAKAGAEELAADVKATELLINAAINKKVKRFIYLSSAHVYSAQLAGEINELTETTNTHPYALNHLKKEQLVLSANSGGKLEGIVVRLSNAFGAPVDSGADCWMLLVNDLCRQVVTYNNITLNSTGAQRRDFIAISDFCNAIDLLISLTQENDHSGIYNLGGNWAPTVFDMARLIAGLYESMRGCSIGIKKVTNEKKSCNTPSFIYQTAKIGRLGYRTDGEDVINRELYSTIVFCEKEVMRKLKKSK